MDVTKCDVTKQLIFEVRRLAVVSPDNRYVTNHATEACYYDKGVCTDGSIGCIFGQAIRNLGLDWDLSDNVGIITLLQRNNVTALCRETTWCSLLQFEQDFGLSWAEALAITDREVYGVSTTDVSVDV